MVLKLLRLRGFALIVPSSQDIPCSLVGASPFTSLSKAETISTSIAFVVVVDRETMLMNDKRAFMLK